MGDKAPEGLHYVGELEDLISAKRTVVTVEGRDILIIHHQGEFYAIDTYCYHAGSSLQNGDIEELDRKLCIICPKHKFRIGLREGEGLYRGRDRSWHSKGVKQRVHKLHLHQGAVYLHLSTAAWTESDYYQGDKGRAARERLEREGGAEEAGAEEGRSD
ncbi:unnamed protein product [Knipowitschia caucasica]|uniref:Rieske domain-containing protein n=1 Tax=Knipowitschia caucasica TaxID=637954 RepID=A0AAV2M5P8_KNICA